MDSRIGLDFIVENPEYIRKLAAALDTQNVPVKKQVFELLSALCVHNQEGHARALDTLEHFKKLKGERYRLNVIIQELDRATVVEYQTALVAFINCLIISTSRLTDRTRLRNEFIGCHLLPVLNNLRKCAEAEPELAVQLDVFDEQRDSDDAQSLHGPHGVDLNSPLDVFYAILKQVAETPQEIPFLSILQHLLRIDPKEAVSDIIWDTAERLVHRATLLENREDASKLFRAPSVQNKIFCNCQVTATLGTRKQSLKDIPVSPPPPPLGPPAFPPPPPPPPFCIPAPPTAPPLAQASLQKTPQALPAPQDSNDTVIEKLPQQEIPQPKIKMKTINWNKIPNNKVVGKNNIWTQVAYSHQHSPMADMDWSEMEGLFCQQAPPSAHSSPKLGNRESGTETVERRLRKESSEITLLDGKRSLNVNIFLKQFRTSNDDIVQLIRDGAHDDIGAEKLKGLLKILPEVDELDMLKSFDGDFSKLGNAEKFLIQLTNLPNYKLRIESMLLKEEFTSNMSYLEPSIHSMIAAAQDLMTNKPLQEVLYMVLVAGNFLNSGGYAGGAAGVKLTSLQKITDIRANKPNMNLIHFVALQAEKRDKRLLSFTVKVSVLEDAAKTTVEQLHNEINALDIRIKKVKKQIDLPTTEIEIQRQMTEFLQMAEREVSNLQRDMIELDFVRKELAEFFCEDAGSFKLEECFRIFHSFYCKFKQAIADNERRRIQEEQANARRRQREELLATKRRQMGSLAGTPDSDGPFIEMQIYDTRTGFPMKKGRKQNYTSEDEQSLTGSPSLSRRRLGSFNGHNNGSDNITNREEKSPDITPNGSLRRRRSRVLSEEDEGTLMDFLRASGPTENNRERKSWGSLDRSWARKARGNASRKRPALLGTDFSSDRERPSSPSPLTESKTILSAPDEETSNNNNIGNSKPKEWRQKIESWLQANENDQNNERSASTSSARRLTNRRSLEMDSESERSSTLDTLPEGKQVYSGSQSTYRKVYPAWKPSATIDNTDVVSAIETVEEVQPAYQIKDKSAWRKSTLNVANSTEETSKNDSRHTRTNLHSIKEDSDRKGLISSLGERPATDKLTLYIRPPEVQQSSLGQISPRIRDSQQSIDTISISSTTTNNKVDIDQDNIETPPATRKIFIPTPTEKREPIQPTPCRRMLNREQPENNSISLGDGQFDRYSAARRTRRYKRNEPATEVVITANNTESVAVSVPVIIDESVVDNRDTRLKAWQEKLGGGITNKTKIGEREKVEDDKFNRRHRNQTGINHDEIKRALQVSSTSSQKIDIPKSGNRKENQHDNNDEGFEETQSLMSESPSQGASSGGNYEPDQIILLATSDFTKETKPLNRNLSVESTSSETPVAADRPPTTNKRMPSPSLKSSTRITARNNNNTNKIVRASSLRQTLQDQQTNKKSALPRRSNSNAATNRESNSSIQKSNSRNSIVSSRSSLNSATSTSTVKRLPIIKVASNNNNVPKRTTQPLPKAVNATTLRRTPSNKTASSNNNNNNKPPLSFMKPTTSSSTKINSNVAVPSRLSSSFRTKN